MIDGKRLRQLREAQGYSRRELSEKIGVVETQIVRYETGTSDATGDVLARIAQAFGVSADYLLGLTDYPSPDISGDLRPEEAAVIAAWRRGDYREVMRVIGGSD
ncbi:MAG TPA: helix-turn-helix transcriptional regulator [Phototrophicaceae bacterium]|nr:helix-turn-helix transcriptional regulator [Phototrophicaceae bacterium]